MKQDKEVWRSKEFERYISFSFKQKEGKPERRIFVPKKESRRSEK